MTLMIGNDDARLTKVFARRIVQRGAHSWQMAQQPRTHALNRAVIGQALALGGSVGKEENEQSGLHEEHQNKERQQHQDRGDNLEKLARQGIDKSQAAEKSVEKGDAKEVGRGPKMAHTLALWGVIHLYGDGNETHTVPGCEDHQLEFGFVTRSDEGQPTESVQRISSIAGLRIGESNAGLEGEPKVAEPIGKPALRVHVCSAVIRCRASKPISHDDGIGMATDRFEEEGQVGRKVLSVTVDGDGIVEALAHGLFESAHQGGSFAFVSLVGDDADTGIAKGENMSSVVGRTVVHHDDAGCLSEHTFDNAAQCPGVVVGGDDNANPFTHRRVRVWQTSVRRYAVRLLPKAAQCLLPA